VPSIHFAAAGSGLLERLADGADAVGVDSGQSLAVARERVPGVAVQGNLDAARLAAGWPAVVDGVDQVLADVGPGAGHVFNAGHAIPRTTDPAVLRSIADLVHERTAQLGTVAGVVAGVPR
jgi:uroporphyrinogen decarboxylase